MVLAATAAQANVFNMPNGEASLQFVTVGTPATPPIRAAPVGYGSVPYTYQMGEVRCDGRAILPVPQCRRGDRHLRALQQLHGDGLFTTVGIVAERQSGQLHLLGFVQRQRVEQLRGL